MRHLHSSTFLTFGLLSAATFTHAENMVVAPHCLLQKSGAVYHQLATSKTLSLIEIDAKNVEKLAFAKHKQPGCGGFMDVTHEWHTKKSEKGLSSNIIAPTFLSRYEKSAESLRNAPSTSYRIQYEKEVSEAIKQINPQTMWSNLTTLTQFKDRYSRSDEGLKAAQWLKTQTEALAKTTHHEEDVHVYFVKTGNYKQPSVVAKFGNGTEPGVVIGGHMDTLSSAYGGLKPGADDDGSGTVTVLETARTILNSGMQFKKPIYFIWYAAEEMGLVGSQYVVDDFINKKIPVAAVMQMDMTGYAYKNEPTIWLLNDNVNQSLTAYLEKLIQTYVKKPVKYTKCGYACSDHVSWDQAGYTAAAPFEASIAHYNPDIHTSQDTLQNLSLDHMTDFVKLATAFVIELAEPPASKAND